MQTSDKKIGFAVPDREALERINRLTMVYIVTSFGYLILGMALGVGMLVTGNDNFLFTHVHLLLVGFVVFLIYGVGYKLLPTMFFGYPGLPHIRLAWVQYVLANAGLILMILFYNVLPINLQTDTILFVSGVVEFAASFLFVFIMVSCIASRPK
jgi:hypothetical protein